MKKITSEYAEQAGLKLCVHMTVDEKTEKRKVHLMVVDKEGVGHLLGDFSAREVVSGKAANTFADVVPALLRECDDETTELQKIKNQLKQVLQTQQAERSGMAMDIKTVHEEVCEFIRKDPRTDFRFIAGDKCKVRTDDLKYILDDVLKSGWTVDEFAKALRLHKMLDTDKGRLQKWVTDSSGTGSQYRAYVFDVVFKQMEVC